MQAAASNEVASAVHYSTGKSGGRLTWLSARPETAPPKADEGVVPAQHAVPAASLRPLRTAQNPNPPLPQFADPFHDKKTATPAEPDAALAAPDAPSAKDAAKPFVLEREPASQRREFMEKCPSAKDMKKIEDLNTSITPSEGDLPHDCPLTDAVFQPRSFAPTTYTWTASGLCHKPLYFEDVQLERYGHMLGPWVQPFASGAHFFLTIPVLPYKMGLTPPNECLYTLGYYRPGNCAPDLVDPLPLSVRAALFEAGAWVGGVFIIP